MQGYKRETVSSGVLVVKITFSFVIFDQITDSKKGMVGGNLNLVMVMLFQMVLQDILYNSCMSCICVFHVIYPEKPEDLQTMNLNSTIFCVFSAFPTK